MYKNILPAATSNFCGKSVHDKLHHLIFKVKPIEYTASVFGSVFLCTHLIIFSCMEKFSIHHIFSANPWLKIGQRYHKLLNGMGHFPFNVATVKVKA